MLWLWRRHPRPPPPPVLLRVADAAGKPVEQVTLDLTWFPSGKTQRRASQKTAMGLAIVPWLGKELRLSVAVVVGETRRVLNVERDRDEGDRAHEVRV